jgi:hypothetical protein
VRGAALLDPALAQEGGERGQVGQAERGEAGRPPGPGTVSQPRHALVGIAAMPAPDAQTAGDRVVEVAAGGVQHDPGPDRLLVGDGVDEASLFS